MVAWPEGDVGRNGLFEQLGLRKLKYETYLLASAAGITVGPDVFAVDANSTAGGTQQTVEVLHEGGLA